MVRRLKTWIDRVRDFRSILHKPKRVLGFWYHPDYEPKSLADAAHLVGLEPNRIDLLVGRLSQQKVLSSKDIRPSPLAGFEDLRLVHTTGYLESVTDPKLAGNAFGYELNSREADEILRSQRRGVGGTVVAAQAVVEGAVNIGINLGGGFHHATADRASGFCIFNDIAIAIAKLRANGFEGSIAIVDLDFHQGNGNLAVFANDPSVLTYSLHGVVWDHRQAVSDRGYSLPPGTGDQEYLKKLEETLEPALWEHHPRLLFYIAGNDVLAGDRLGNFALSPQGVLDRDCHVIKTAEELGIPLVITLGGGYSPQSWRCTANLLTYLITGEAKADENSEPDLRKKFAKIARTMRRVPDREEARAEDDRPENLSESEILGDLSSLTRVRQLLDYYSVHGVEFAFERFGILKKIRDHGFDDFRFEVDTSDPDRQIVRIYGRRTDVPAAERSLLLEMVLHLSVLPPPKLSGFSTPLRVLSVKWLLIQDPRSDFSLKKPRLPGQAHPGLGIAEDIQEFLVQYCQRAHLDGLLSTPSHFHNASVASRWFHFLDPANEGRLLAIRQVFLKFHLSEASELIEQGALGLRDGTAVKWEPAEQILPVSRRLKAFFSSPAYRMAAVEECQNLLQAGLQTDPTKTGKILGKTYGFFRN